MLGFLDGPEKMRVLEKAPVFDRPVDYDTVRWNAPTGPEMKVSGLGVSDGMSGHPDRFPGSLESYVGELRPESIEMRR